MTKTVGVGALSDPLPSLLPLKRQEAVEPSLLFSSPAFTLMQPPNERTTIAANHHQ
jgi:hypothetical protein